MSRYLRVRAVPLKGDGSYAQQAICEATAQDFFWTQEELEVAVKEARYYDWLVEQGRHPPL